MLFNFPALGTHWWFEIWDDIDESALKKIAQHLYETTENFEKKFSRFQPESLISILNHQRTISTVDPEFIAVIKYGQQLYNRTDQVFNILTGNILELRGYGKTSTQEQAKLTNTSGNPLEDILFTDTGIQLSGSSHIDIGGFGKGWLIDKLATILRQEFQCQEFLINGGGDIYATHQNGKPIEIHLEEPLNPEKIMDTIKIKNQGFAGSSPNKRSWKKQIPDGTTQLYNHIVATAATELKSGAHVIAETAVEADAFATTLLQLDDTTAQTLAEKEGFTT